MLHSRESWPVERIHQGSLTAVELDSFRCVLRKIAEEMSVDPGLLRASDRLSDLLSTHQGLDSDLDDLRANLSKWMNGADIPRFSRLDELARLHEFVSQSEIASGSIGER